MPLKYNPDCYHSDGDRRSAAVVDCFCPICMQQDIKELRDVIRSLEDTLAKARKEIHRLNHQS